jgi:pimeloyl-ACP methyl ester carboxylesterase
MSTQRTHSVTAGDGAVIVGAVHGQGPPLVFLQGVIGDGDIDWQALVPHLTGRCTCYLPSWRGRGLSGDHPDLSFGRLVDDMRVYVDSIAEPSGLVGWSGGAGLALAVAARTDAVAAVAPVEPNTPRMMNEQEQAGLGEAVARMGQLAGEGRLTDAARAFARFLFSDEEVAVAEQAGYFSAAGRYVPKLLDFFQQLMEYHGPTHEDPAVLGAISAPVLALVGSDTKAYVTAYARYVADHVPNAAVQEIPGAGHASPLTHPAALAEALTEFFEPTRSSA